MSSKSLRLIAVVVLSVSVVVGIYFYGTHLADSSRLTAEELARVNFVRHIANSDSYSVRALSLSRDQLHARTVAPFQIRVSYNAPQSPEGALHGSMIYQDFTAMPWGLSAKPIKQVEVW